MSLVFVNRYFYPDHAATAQMLADLAFHAARQGHDVIVVTARQRLQQPRARLPSAERIAGVEVIRTWSTRFGRSSTPGRVLDYLSFHLSVFLTLLGVLKPGDTLVAATDPPLLGVTAAAAARLRDAALVNWLHDLFPEVAQALGVLPPRSVVGTGLRRLRDASLRCARTNVVLGGAMAARLEHLGIAPDRVTIIRNWSDGDTVRPIPHANNPLRREWAPDDAVVVMYSGNLGRAHDLSALPDAAHRVRDLTDLLFLVIGDGAGRAPLQEAVRGRGLENVRFLDYQPRDRLALSLAAADVHLTGLRPSLEGLVVPSKLYGAMAAGRPVVHLGDASGEVGQTLLAADCGLVVAPDDADALAQALRTLHDDAPRRGRMGRAARAAFEQRFDQRHALGCWMTLLE